MLELENVTKTYRRGRGLVVEALRGVDLRVAAGELLAVMGPSGSGKSTLLHLLGALDVPTSGRVRFGGDDLGRLSDWRRSELRRDRIGYVFQSFNLLPTLTAAENVALPLLLGGGGERRRSAPSRAREELQRVGLADRADHYPEQLSGGQMQRVALARALVTRPAVVLCDEPTGNLDSACGAEVLALLRGLPGPGRCVVMVTHDETAARRADRVAHIRDGRLVAETYPRGSHAHHPVPAASA
jgi:putative ABC transport system ATP-binding protein